tara:strand:- start:375 stop:2360 length:1986 start_codon:yes stop_codon:yes gene_type:complete
MAKNVVIKITQKGAKKTTKALKSVGGAVASVGTKATLVTGGIAALSTKLAGDFQKNLLEVSTLMGKTTNKELANMSRELRLVSQTSGLALSSLSKAKYDIVSAGFSSAAESSKVLAVSAKLAVGGVTSAAEAADLLTTALNAMGKDADDVNKVADSLFTTVRLGKTTMSELAASMGQVLPFARSAGLSLDNVNAAMATITASGISTAQATTSLRAALVSLTSPAESSKKAMEEAGIEIKRFDDGSLNLTETVKQFQGLDPDTFKKIIPRVEAILGIQTMANNFGTLTDNVETFATDSANATEKAFDKMASGFNQQMAMLKNSVQSVMIEIGNVLIEIIQPKIEDVNKEFEKLGEIGFDSLGIAVKDNLPVIMEAFEMTMLVAFNHIGKQAEVLGLTIKEHIADAIPFIEGDFEKIAEFQKILGVKAEQDTEYLAQLYKDMYQGIVSDAESAANDDFELSQAVVDFKADGAMKEAKLRKTVINPAIIETGAIIKKVNTNEKVMQIELQRVKAQAIQEDIRGAILQGQTAEGAMMSVVRAELMEAISGLMSSIFRNMPFPLNVVLAAGAGATATGLLEKGLSAAKGIKFADGGIVPGINSGAGDTVPAMLTPGELILNRAQQENLVGGTGGLTINFNAPVTSEDFVKDFIVPEIEKTVSGSLA